MNRCKTIAFLSHKLIPRRVAFYHDTNQYGDQRGAVYGLTFPFCLVERPIHFPLALLHGDPIRHRLVDQY